LIQQDFTAEKPNQKWATDFTYLFLTGGDVRYNCTIIDLHDRSVIASITDRHITSDLAIRTLDKALASQKSISPDLILLPKEKFDFHKAYIRDVKLDITYNYPRVWALQAFFSPKLKNDVTKNTFPVYAKGEKPISLSDVRRAYYHHYQGTEHDPYFHENPKEVYRPVAIFRATNTHILQVRPELPEAIGEINYVALGMAALGIFIPLYQGVTSYPEAYSKGDNHCSSDSAYWILRKVQTLGMVNYKKYAPVIRDVYDRFEKEMEQRQREMEANYLAIYKAQPIAAQELLQKFSDKLLEDILQVSRDLLDDLFTRLTLDVQAEYRFAGA